MARWMTLALTVALLVGSGAWGQIVTYDFTGNPGTQPQTVPTTIAQGFTFSSLTRGLGLSAYPPLENSMNSTLVSASIWPANLRYYTWKGNPINFPEWSFNYVRTGYATSGSLPTAVSLEYSPDNGNAWYNLSSINLTSSSGDLNFTFSAVTVPQGNISGATFKLTVLGGVADNTTFALTNGSFGGLQVGIQAVPEPGSIILTSLALAGGAGIRFFRRRMRESEAESTGQAGVE